MACVCIQELAKLRRSSMEAVDNTDSFDDFKKYMHISREIEDQLKSIIRSVNKDLDKCLIMLSGSTGDGKSHLISYLKNAEPENLLEGYETYNDSTESDEPSLEFLEALAKQLENFNDDNITNSDNTKMIIAINLGIIGKLFDSEEGKNFQKLREYVEDNNILSSYSYDIGYKEGSVFQHVSFSDYQVFGLSEDGIHTEYLESLFDKVFSKDAELNPFYKVHCSCNCTLASKCPVYHNYELLQNKNVQKYVIGKIIQIIIEDKAIMSTRDVLNLIYDIIVSEKFSEQELMNDLADETKYLMDYVNWSSPMLLNEYADISEKLKLIKAHDVFQNRTEDVDLRTMKFHSMENIEHEFRNSTQNTPYSQLLEKTSISVFGGIKPELKRQVYKFIIRLEEMTRCNEGLFRNVNLKNYLKNIYYQNKGGGKYLSKFYEQAKMAILTWDGKFEDNNVCIDATNDSYWILEQLFIESESVQKSKSTEDVIYRFSPELRIRFKNQFGIDDSAIETGIDYSLYKLICDMEEGYKPNVKDKNLHTDFISYVKSLTELGLKSKKVIIQAKSGEKTAKYSFEETAGGYKFRVI